MKLIKNEKGIALVTALLLTLISLTFMMALLYMLTQGTKTSASSRHYANALEATYGGVDFFTGDALLTMMMVAHDSTFTSAAVSASYPGLNMTFAAGINNCMQAKLTSTVDKWGPVGTCTEANLSSDISRLPATADMKFTLPGTTGSSAYTVYSKIVDTQIGNTDTSGTVNLLVAAGVTQSSVYNSATTKIPYLFTVEMQGEAATNPQEKTRVTMLVAY